MAATVDDSSRFSLPVTSRRKRIGVECLGAGGAS
uniref:Uncharacterized protein n=1 Tax=Arundo donax TaxID=35708 RepID=A0A0A9CMZ6_ARUDO